MPTVARAPGLGGDPGEDLERVVLLLREVLVLENSVGVAATRAGRRARPRSRVRRSRDGGSASRCGRPVALAVRDVLEDRRHGIALGVLAAARSARRGGARPTARSRRSRSRGSPEGTRFGRARRRSLRTCSASCSAPNGYPQPPWRRRRRGSEAAPGGRDDRRRRAREPVRQPLGGPARRRVVGGAGLPGQARRARLRARRLRRRRRRGAAARDLDGHVRRPRGGRRPVRCRAATARRS